MVNLTGKLMGLIRVTVLAFVGDMAGLTVEDFPISLR